MSVHPPDRIWSGIDVFKLVAGTLAAVAAAVLGSFLGVAGTLIGAGIASVVSTLGTEVFAKSLNRGYTRLTGKPAPTQPPVAAPAAMGTPAVTATAGHAGPGHFDPVPPADSGPKAKRPRWKLVLVPAMAVFVLAMGAIFAVESMARESIPSMLGKPSSGANTLASLLDGKADPAPSPKVTGTPAVEESGPAADETVPAGEPTATEGPTGEQATPGTPAETGEAEPTQGGETTQEQPAEEKPADDTPQERAPAKQEAPADSSGG